MNELFNDDRKKSKLNDQGKIIIPKYDCYMRKSAQKKRKLIINDGTDYFILVNIIKLQMLEGMESNENCCLTPLSFIKNADKISLESRMHEKCNCINK